MGEGSSGFSVSGRGEIPGGNPKVAPRSRVLQGQGEDAHRSTVNLHFDGAGFRNSPAGNDQTGGVLAHQFATESRSAMAARYGF